MTAFFKVGGVFSGTDVGQRVRLGSDWEFTTSALSGTISFSGVPMDDPSGDLTIQGLKGFIGEETACSLTRTFTGYVDTRTFNRGRPSHRLAASRLQTVQLVDVNAVAGFRVLKGLEAKRPAETDVERVAWLLGTDEFGVYVQDLGFVSTDDPRNLDAFDFRGSYPSDVLTDAAKVKFGKNWFIYYDEVEAAIGLFYDQMDATTWTSTLSISNVPGEYDQTTVFDPYLEPTLERDPAGVYDGVLVRYGDGSMIYRQNDTTHATYGLYRDAVYDNPKIGRMSTAESFAAQFLARAATEHDTISATIEVPRASVNLVQAGMRMHVKFSHFGEPYASGTYMRVTRRTVRQSKETDQSYEVELELMTSGPSGGTGGGATPRPEPWVPCPPATPSGTAPGVIQAKEGLAGSGSALTLDNPPTSGHTMIWVLFNFQQTSTPVGDDFWTLAGYAHNVTLHDGNVAGTVMIYYHTALPGETGAYLSAGGDNRQLPNGGTVGYLFEVDQALTLADTAETNDAPASSDLDPGAVSPTASAPAFLVGGVVQYNGLIVAPVTPDGGITETVDRSSNSFTGGIDFRWAWVGYQSTSSASAGMTVAGTGVGFDWAGVTAAFSGVGTTDDSDCPPPVPGQPVAPLELTVTDCDRLDYTVPTGSYESGMLNVGLRDGATVTPLLFTELDPDAGTFRLLDSPCTLVPSTTEALTVYDAVTDEWKFMFMPDGTPMTVTVPGTTGGVLPTLIVDYTAGPAVNPDDPPVIVPPPPATAPATVTDWFPDAPTLASDQSADIEAWIAATAGVGKVLGFAAGVYRTDDRIFVDTIDNVTIVATGATFRRVTTSASGDAILLFWSCDNLAVFNLTVQGPASTSDVASITYPGTRENEHGIMLVDVHGATLSHPTITNVWGDGIYYARIGAGAATTLCTDILIDTAYIATSGRNAISHISGQRITIKDLIGTDLSLHGFDVEGNASDDVCADVTITGPLTSITDYGTGFGSHGVTGYAIQVGPGYGGNVAQRVLLDGGEMDLAQINIQGPSSGSPAQDITFRNWLATTAGTSQVVHVSNWVNQNNDADFTLPASGNVT